MNKALFLILALAALDSRGGQVTYAPQGPAALRTVAGRTIRNIQIVGLVACSTQPISGGVLWQQAVMAGFSPIAVSGGGVLRVAASKHWYVLASRAIQVGTMIAAGMVASGTIKGSASVISGLVSAHGVADQVKSWLDSDAPNPAPAIDAIIDPAKRYVPGESGCIQGLLIANFSRSMSYKAVTASLP